KYIPFGPIVNFEGFHEGDGPHTLSLPDAPSFSPLVCYEVIFAGEVTAKNEPRPEWILNVTNDAWYGISPGPLQHLAQAQYRAIEEGLPIVRVANTGVSAIFDAYGREILQTGLFSDAAPEYLLPQPTPQMTIYSKLNK
ncbi:MAG: nitrilase-related carbon-nitrogen hydrolase, partial [Pseudomonadota bacterium]